jgi:hypothetical protein
MAIAITKLAKKYGGRFNITGKDGWLAIRGRTPLPEDYHNARRKAFLDYNVEILDPRFSDTLEDRTRNVWLRDEQGRGFRSVSYCSGIGIWQVSQDGNPMAFNDLNSQSQETAAQWLKKIDDYVSESIPEVEQLIKQRKR